MAIGGFVSYSFRGTNNFPDHMTVYATRRGMNPLRGRCTLPSLGTISRKNIGTMYRAPTRGMLRNIQILRFERKGGREDDERGMAIIEQMC
jgi:hypothetical protein